MQKQTTWPTFVFAYLLWVLALALGVWILLRARAVYPVIAGLLSNEGEFQTRQIAMFADRAVVFGVGIAWIALMVIAEHLFRTRAALGKLWRTAAALFGGLLLVLGLTELLDLLIVNAGLPLPAMRWVYALALLVGSVVLIWYSRQRKSRQRPGRLEPPTAP